MSTTETSLLGDIFEKANKKRRLHMLPMYSRIMIIIGSILGGLATLISIYFTFYSIITGLMFNLPILILNISNILFCLVFCLGNALLWAEKKDAIGLGMAACICGMLLSFSVGMNLSLHFLPAIVYSLPLFILYVIFFIRLTKVRTIWKTEGLSLQELRRLKSNYSSSSGTIVNK
ncbi:hypothetical protein ACE38W_01330 [Chitinophaga sp. Hz27]|uniref:hypothetical protein n=1 Tax=Chitinophaga sp. Hz27 TaxID=3347169 RepID=UPI0035D72231